MAIESLGKILSGARVVGIDVNSKHVLSRIIFLDTYPGHSGYLEETRGMPPLNFFQLRFGSHH